MALEADFRPMKDPDVVSFSPMFHWTDPTIRVHAFYCTLALNTARRLARGQRSEHERAREKAMGCINLEMDQQQSPAELISRRPPRRPNRPPRHRPPSW